MCHPYCLFGYRCFAMSRTSTGRSGPSWARTRIAANVEDEEYYRVRKARAYLESSPHRSSTGSKQSTAKRTRLRILI